jgi:hypothetical protein
MVLILEVRSHLDLGDLPNLLAAELGVMTVRLERAVRSLDGVARVHVNRWGDSSAHLHMWFLARPYGQLQLRGTFLSLWDDILPPIPESVWRENLALVAAWLAEFGGTPLAEPPHIEWQAPSSLTPQAAPTAVAAAAELAVEPLSVAIAEAPEGVSDGAPEAVRGAQTAGSPDEPALGAGVATAPGAGVAAADGSSAGAAAARRPGPTDTADGAAANGGEAVAVAEAAERGPGPVVVAGASKPAKP